MNAQQGKNKQIHDKRILKKKLLIFLHQHCDYTIAIAVIKGNNGVDWNCGACEKQ